MKANHDPEQELDRLINRLNAERRPETPSTSDMAGLFDTVRAVRALKEPADPAPGFEARLLRRVRGARTPSRWWLSAAAVAAVLLLALLLPVLPGRDLAVAMARAVTRVNTHHGTLTVRAVSSAGEEQLLYTREIWVEESRYATLGSDGVLTVNNGERKWQVRPAEKLVAVLPAVPDMQRLGLDLKEEGTRAARYPHRLDGREQVAGRWCTVLAVTPPGGETYRLWVDEETNLPVQLETAMLAGWQTIRTFTSLEVNQPLPPDLFTYKVPPGYRVLEENPGQEAKTVAEAADIAGFTPLLPETPPLRLIAYQDRIVLDYGDSAVVQRKAEGPFTPAEYGAMGTVDGGPVEILEHSLRWRQEGLEITATGPAMLRLARALAPAMEMPHPGTEFPQVPAFGVPMDLEEARTRQQQVDAGHSPWRLSPTQVALEYVNQVLVPAQPVPFGSFRVIYQSGTHAIVRVEGGPVGKVYLQRLIRQDSTGIWSVVGYDQ